MIENDFYNNLTICFSGYNIKEYLYLSINSLLYFYPDFRDKIMVFDDNSTDGTKEWLEKNEIKRISWLNNYDLTNTSETGYRVGCIFKEIFDQCPTKYLMLNDGDIIFYDYFQYNYHELILKRPLIMEIIPIENKMSSCVLKLLKKYNYTNTIYINNIYHRVNSCHFILDLEYIKRKGITYFDRLSSDWKILCQNLDLGADFFHQIIENQILFYYFTYDKYIYHFGWKSSVNRLLSELYEGEENIKNYILSRNNKEIELLKKELKTNIKLKKMLKLMENKKNVK